MTGDRDVLDELRAALDVAPSPGFEARVRAHVGAVSTRRPMWTWCAGVAVAATVVLAVLLVPERSRVVQPDVVATVAPGDAAPAVAGAAPAPASSHVVEVKAARHASRTTAAATPPDAMNAPARSDAVVIPAGQEAGIQRLLREIAAGRVAMAPPRPELPEVLEIAAIAPPSPITFEPLTVAPLSVDATPDLWR